MLVFTLKIKSSSSCVYGTPVSLATIKRLYCGPVFAGRKFLVILHVLILFSFAVFSRNTVSCERSIWLFSFLSAHCKIGSTILIEKRTHKAFLILAEWIVGLRLLVFPPTNRKPEFVTLQKTSNVVFQFRQFNCYAKNNNGFSLVNSVFLCCSCKLRCGTKIFETLFDQNSSVPWKWPQYILTRRIREI